MVNRVRTGIYLSIFLMSIQAFAQNPPWRDPAYSTDKYDFTLKGIDGSDIKLSSFKGKAVLLNLWATWCGPCRQETPGFVKVYEKLGGDKRMVFLAVAIWDEEPAIRTFIAKYQVPYLVANDGSDTVAKLYRAQSIPESYLINADGKLAYHFAGPVQESELEARLLRVLESSNSAK